MAPDTRAAKLLTRGALEHRLQIRLQQLRADLQVEQPDAETVHRIRVEIKHCRGWIRLLRASGGRSGGRKWRRMDVFLKRSATHLGVLRDRQVAQETLAWLAKRTTDNAVATDCHALGAALLNGRQQSRRASRPSRPDRSDLARLQDLAEAVPSPQALQQGISALSARMLALAVRVGKPGASAAQLHHFRKWVKYLAGILALITPAGSGRRRKKTLEKLGKQLGRLQDLKVLERLLKNVDAEDDVRAAAARVRTFARAQRHALRARCAPASFATTLAEMLPAAH